MSIPMRRFLCAGFTRCLSTSACASAEASTSTSTRKPQLQRKELGMMDIRKLENYEFDDPTSLGFMRLEKIKEAQELFRKTEVDRPVLQGQRKAFKPPTGPIRITSTIDLSYPNSPRHVKKVLEVPISALPLSGPDAVNRLKLIAGPRWTRDADGIDKIKISEETFPDARMNRKSASDKLDRLIAAANDAKSPIPKNTPVDSRHMLARQRQKRQQSAQHVWRRSEAMKARPGSVGGVRGFPKEWLAQSEITKA